MKLRKKLPHAKAQVRSVKLIFNVLSLNGFACSLLMLVGMWKTTFASIGQISVSCDRIDTATGFTGEPINNRI